MVGGSDAAISVLVLHLVSHGLPHLMPALIRNSLLGHTWAKYR
jgi:hypothetical protein